MSSSLDVYFALASRDKQNKLNHVRVPLDCRGRRCARVRESYTRGFGAWHARLPSASHALARAFRGVDLEPELRSGNWRTINQPTGVDGGLRSSSIGVVVVVVVVVRRVHQRLRCTRPTRARSTLIISCWSLGTRALPVA